MRLKILLALNDLNAAPKLVDGLENEGFYVDFVGSGMEALQKLRAPFFDVVLIDLQLVQISGAAIAGLLRGVAGGYRQPLLIGLASSPETRVTRLADFQAILHLPVTAGQLVGAIQRARAAVNGSMLPTPKSVPTGVRANRILLVEDDSLFSSILSNALHVEGFVVDHVVDGEAALRLGRVASYDLAVLDFKLPGIDGLATAQQAWGGHQASRRPALIALTSSPGQLLAQDGDGPVLFDEVLCKSGGLGAVLRAVRRHLPNRPMPSEIQRARAAVAS